MLRIGSKKELILAKPKGGFSSDMIVGLILALGLHLALFFGLRITSPPNYDHVLPILPVAVEIDLGSPQLVSTSQTKTFYFPLEKVALPPLPEIPTPSLCLPPICMKEMREPDFREIEKIPYTLLEDLEDD